ncbi:MAG: DUF896 domain-containing protein [Negativicutes bacterium]|nr:DUF896 domain-containing protein [Negativicutes bacterium]
MEQTKIERLNQLAKKAKAEGLTEAELAERDLLRKQYIAAYRSNLEAQLENIVVLKPDGSQEKLPKKEK